MQIFLKRSSHLLSTMCHSRPFHHPCNHQSVEWLYCGLSTMNFKTGYQDPCANISVDISYPSRERCPLENCDFHNVEGYGWVCCRCRGVNWGGWCTNNLPNPGWEETDGMGELYLYRLDKCDHGCCRDCTKLKTVRGVSTICPRTI